MAARYLVSGGNGQWNSTTNWSATSGGAAGASFPTSADSVTIDAASNNANITVDVESACTSFTVSNYAGTVTVNNTLTCSSNFTFNSGSLVVEGLLSCRAAITFATGVSYSGLGILESFPGSSATITSNGVLITGTLKLYNRTYTISGTLTVENLLINNSTSTTTINSGTINTKSLLCENLTSGTVVGTSKINLYDTGTVSCPSVTAGYISNNIDINSVSTTFIGVFPYQSGTITYIAGNVITTDSTLRIYNGIATLNTNGMTWDTIQWGIYSTSNYNLTLQSDLQCSTLKLNNSYSIARTTTITSTGFIINCDSFEILTGSNHTISGSNIRTKSLVFNNNFSNYLGGTTKITLVGTGTVSFPNMTLGSTYISNPIDINSVSTTFTGNIGLRGTVTYIAGQVNASNSTLVVDSTTVLNTAGMLWGNVRQLSTSITLPANFECSGTITVTTSTFSVAVGSTGQLLTVGNLATTVATTITLRNNLTVTGDIQTTTVAMVINGFTITTGGANLGTAGISGTTAIVFGGTGTWTSTGGSITNNVTINTTGTLTVNNGRFATGTLTYTAGTVDSSTGGLICTNSCTLNTSGVTWNIISLVGTITLSSVLNATTTKITGTCTFVNTGRFTQTNILSLESTATSTFTLINNITVLDTLVVSSNFLQTLNGFQIICNGGITTEGSTGYTRGTTTILLNGTGTWTASGITSIGNSTTINTAGTITFSGNVYFNTGTLTYTAGTVITTGSTLNCWATTTLNTAGITWNNVYFVSATITLSSVLTVSGNTSLYAGVGFTNGATRFTQTGSLTLIESTIFTLPTNFTVLGTTTFSNTTSTAQTLNGFTLICNGGISVEGAGTGTIGGTTSILLNGTGTWTSDRTDVTATSNTITNNVTINTTGTITFSGIVNYSTGALTYTAGTVITTGSTLCSRSSTTLNTAGITWDNILLGGTTTLPSNLTATGTLYIDGTTSFTADRFTQAGNLQLFDTAILTLPNNFTVLGNVSTENTSTANTVNDFTLTVGGGITTSNTSTGTLEGSTLILLNGTGTWSGIATVKNNLTINTAGVITTSGNITYDTGTLTYVAGTVTTPGSKLNIANNTTLDTDGITWWDVDVNASCILTLLSRLQIADALTLNAAAIDFVGTSGFTCNYLNQTAIGTVTLASTIDYVVQSGFVSEISTNALRSLFKASIAGSKAILTLQSGAAQSLGYVDATDIDSSLGKKLWSFKTALSNTDNWQELTAAAAASGDGTTNVGSSYTWVA